MTSFCYLLLSKVAHEIWSVNVTDEGRQKSLNSLLNKMIKPFPRLTTLCPQDSTYVQAKRHSKDVLLATIYQLQIDNDKLTGKVDVINKQEIQGWSGVIKKFRNQLDRDVKTFTKEMAHDIRTMRA